MFLGCVAAVMLHCLFVYVTTRMYDEPMFMTLASEEITINNFLMVNHGWDCKIWAEMGNLGFGLNLMTFPSPEERWKRFRSRRIPNNTKIHTVEPDLLIHSPSLSLTI